MSRKITTGRLQCTFLKRVPGTMDEGEGEADFAVGCETRRGIDKYWLKPRPGEVRVVASIKKSRTGSCTILSDDYLLTRIRHQHVPDSQVPNGLCQGFRLRLLPVYHEDAFE